MQQVRATAREVRCRLKNKFFSVLGKKLAQSEVVVSSKAGRNNKEDGERRWRSEKAMPQDVGRQCTSCGPAARARAKSARRGINPSHRGIHSFNERQGCNT